jgi:hypothetical protein
MNAVTLRIPDTLLTRVRSDLRRSHPFAGERVGFILCRAAAGPCGWTILAYGYQSIPDDAYVDDPRYGATVSSVGFLPALQAAYAEPISVCHVHLHDHSGPTRFSRPDERESAQFMPDFLKVRPGLPHSAIVVGKDHLWGKCWTDRETPSVVISELHVVGAPILTSWNHHG